MRVIIDRSRCVGHAQCAAHAPELFELDDLGYIAADAIEVPAGMEERARKGARACPERIITIVEGD